VHCAEGWLPWRATVHHIPSCCTFGCWCQLKLLLYIATTNAYCRRVANASTLIFANVAWPRKRSRAHIQKWSDAHLRRLTLEACLPHLTCHAQSVALGSIGCKLGESMALVLSSEDLDAMSSLLLIFDGMRARRQVSRPRRCRSLCAAYFVPQCSCLVRRLQEQAPL
jgi:hypothetical protein